MASDPSVILDYAPRPQRRPWRRWVLVGVAVLILSLSLWWGPRVYDRAALLYWQHKCLRYKAPPGQVVLVANGETFSPPFPPPACWVEYCRKSGAPAYGTWFLHERRPAGGKPRLIAVDSSCTYSEYFYNLWLTDLNPPAGGIVETNVPIGRANPLTIYAGEPDPEDESHFTIAYDTGDRRWIIDGWVLKDGLRFEKRKPVSNSQPTTAP